MMNHTVPSMEPVTRSHSVAGTGTESRAMTPGAGACHLAQPRLACSGASLARSLGMDVEPVGAFDRRGSSQCR